MMCSQTIRHHSTPLPVDAVLALQVCHTGGGVDREANKLLRLHLVFLLP